MDSAKLRLHRRWGRGRSRERVQSARVRLSREVPDRPEGSEDRADRVDLAGG